MAQILDLEEVSDDDIDKGMGLIEEVYAYLEKVDRDESSNCIVVLGTSGVGKSTVGSGKENYSCTEFSRTLIAENPTPGVDIPSGSSSKILMPWCWNTWEHRTREKRR
ncbi:hypothetical protein PI124_g9938 [Phytophthora idaei]|nr:hypothetical protein PI125_g6042 [Phytophthora idaei]KAG3156354.1 hypothetical protein PI126_g8789 [Phytophthora idaei]KAG3245317.1 hypothetical protein PI124_g9938 [Phytophthora idaei]